MSRRFDVVATRVGGLPEIVAHERIGWLADPGDDRGAACLLRYIATEAGEVARVTRLARRFAEAGLRLDGKMMDTLMAYCTADAGKSPPGKATKNACR